MREDPGNPCPAKGGEDDVLDCCEECDWIDVERFKEALVLRCVVTPWAWAAVEEVDVDLVDDPLKGRV